MFTVKADPRLMISLSGITFMTGMSRSSIELGLMKFKRGLLNNDISGRILCYDFQVDFVQKIMCPAKVKINNIKIRDVREMIENEKS